MRDRCELDIDGSHHDNCLYPSNASDEGFHLKEYPNLDPLLQLRPQLTNFGDHNEKNDINKEWALLSSIENLPDEIKTEDKVERFWNKIYNYKDASGNFLFRKLGVFMMKYLIIPHSNATSERVWSRLKRQKTYKRASLKFASIRAIMLSYQYIADVGLDEFEPTMGMYYRMAFCLQDKQDNSRRFEDRSMFKDKKITDDQKKRSFQDRKYGLKYIF